MRNVLIALSLALVILSGCSKSSGDPAREANRLIRAKNLSLPVITSMDSVMDYPEAFSCLMASHNLQWNADSLLQVNIKNGTVSQNKKELLEMGETVRNLREQAARLRLQGQMKNTPVEFVGYQVMVADSLSDDMFEVFLYEDMSKIAINKIKI